MGSKSSALLFAHQSQQIPVGITKEGHPKFVVRHPRHEMRFGLKDDMAILQGLVCLIDISDFKIERSAKLLGLGLFPAAQHESDIAASEEREAGWRAEQVFQAEGVPVKSDSFVEVINRKRDLSDLVQGNHARFLQSAIPIVNA